MTLKPDHSLFVDFPPISGGIDLVERVFAGVCQAKEMGFDLVFILEDDDAYGADYFERFGDTLGVDFFGDDLTYYYHLKQRAFSSFHHPKRSSLFTTGFRISKIEGFQWGGDQFLDIRLWKWANEKKLHTKFVNTGAIGIKHNQGRVAGKGHIQIMRHMDHKMEWLKSRVDEKSFEFYQSLSQKLIYAD
jgi:hypothetical protein